MVEVEGAVYVMRTAFLLSYRRAVQEATAARQANGYWTWRRCDRYNARTLIVETSLMTEH